MTDVLKPRDARDVEEAVRWAVADDKALELAGHGSKRGIGRPSQTDLTLDLSGLTGVTLYEPEELVLSAKAGTPIAEIEALLDENNQQLAFEPADYGALFGQPAGQGTLGGVVAANLSGPRRLKAGAARDHVLGIAAVTGRADTIKTGGRVVKNVTGYDLCKVLAGSWGTLAAMTEITVKVLPKPETEATVLVGGLSDADACAAMAAAMGSSADVSGAAHLPDHVASWFDGLPKPEAATVLRLEGFAPSVKHRREQLAAQMKGFGPVAILEESRLARAVARRARRQGLRRGVGAAPAAVAHLDRAGERPSPGRPDHAGGADVLRLGRRPGLGRHALRGRAGRRLGARRGRRARRPRHAYPRAGGGARRGRRVPAGGAGPARAQQAREGELRPQGRAQSRTHVGGGVMTTTRVPGAARRATLRCRPGTATKTEFATVPDLRCALARCTASGTQRL